MDILASINHSLSLVTRLREVSKNIAEAVVPDDAPELVGLDAIRAAAATLAGIAVRTPLVPFGPPERRQWLKAESLQPVGSFKIRGAYTAATAIPADLRARGLITYSSGNHAQGVARAARLLGVPAAIVMPSDAPEIKRRRVEADGAQVARVGPASEERRRVAEELARSGGSERELAELRASWDDEIEAAARSGDYRVRGLAYRSIAQFRFRQKLELLRRGLEDESAGARGSALIALRALSADHPGDVNGFRPLLNELAMRDPNDAVRRQYLAM